MKRPPMLIRVQIRGEERGFGLWLPLFLLLPLVLVLLIILSPVMVIAIIILGRGRRLDRLPPIARTCLSILCSVRRMRAAFGVICSMPGLRIDVGNGNERVYVSVI
jgi:hypothetical protein